MPQDMIPDTELELSGEEQAYYSRYTARKTVFLFALLAVLLVAGAATAAIGAANLKAIHVFQILLRLVRGDSTDIDQFTYTVVVQLRLPRICMAMLTGIALGSSGAVMQGVLRNPLVSPYTLGLSSGAAAGAALAIVLGVTATGLGHYLVIVGAFVFALLTMAVVFALSRIRGTSTETLILSGVALGYLFSALVSALKYFSTNEALREIVYWLMGGIYATRWNTVFILTPLVIPCTVFAIRLAWDLNALSAGEEVATSLGVNVHRVRRWGLLLSSVLTASVISFTGIIGFIGLVAPHICRLIIGSDHRYLIPTSGLMGAMVLLVADTASRTMIRPTEIPVGVLTAFIGVPFFLYLLSQKKRRWWN